MFDVSTGGLGVSNDTRKMQTERRSREDPTSLRRTESCLTARANSRLGRAQPPSRSSLASGVFEPPNQRRALLGCSNAPR
jgi:hypothetical protein